MVKLLNPDAVGKMLGMHYYWLLMSNTEDKIINDFIVLRFNL